MRPGDIVLIRMPRAGEGPGKLRPALVLAPLPGPYQNLLVCGISTRLSGLEADWDEVVRSDDADFPTSGLHRASAIRLSFLAAVESTDLAGCIGNVDGERLKRLLARLARLLSGLRHGKAGLRPGGAG